MTAADASAPGSCTVRSTLHLATARLAVGRATGRASRVGWVLVCVSVLCMGSVPPLRVLDASPRWSTLTVAGGECLGPDGLEAWATPTLFVAPDGSDGHLGTTPDRPLETAAEAARRARAGDVVAFRDGTYRGNWTIDASGTAERPIVFTSYPGECAVFEGDGRWGDGRVTDLTQAVVTVRGVHHVVVERIVVRNSRGLGVWIDGADDVTVRALRVHGNAGSGVLVYGGSNVLLERIVSYANFDAPRGVDADGISLSSGTGHRVVGCVTFGNSDDGVDTWKTHGATIERCISFGNGFEQGDGNGFKLGGGRVGADARIERSVAFDNRAAGFDENTGIGVAMIHNTAFGNGGVGFQAERDRVNANLSVANAVRDGPGSRSDNVEEGNSWNLGIDERALLSLDPTDADFLALDPDGPAAGAKGRIEGHVGALAPGERLGDLIDVVLGLGRTSSDVAWSDAPTGM